jgi:hypothetical protein
VKRTIPYEFTEKQVSPWGGIRLIKEFYDRIGMYEKLRELPLYAPGSGAGTAHHEIIESFMTSVILGAGTCSGASMLGYDTIVKEIFGWEKGMPSQSTLSRFFPKYSIEKSDEIFSEFFYWWFSQMKEKNLTLDIDSTVITRFGEQEGAEKGYNARYRGRKSHHPIIAFVAETKMVANAWMRTGDSASSTEFVEFLDNTFTMLPREKVSLLRADSGFCSNKTLNNLEGRKLRYIIAMPMKAGLVEKILNADGWISSETEGADLCCFQYKSKGWSKSRRVVVVRKDTEILSKCGGKTLFSHQDDFLRYKYSAFVTTSDLSCELVWVNYRHRAEAENQIKELKYDYGIEGFCFRDMAATEFAFRWVTIAYNLMSMVRNAIAVSQVKHRLPTLRINCIAIGAYLSTSGRQRKLILSAPGKKRDYIEGLFQKIDHFFKPKIISIA